MPLHIDNEILDKDALKSLDLFLQKFGESFKSRNADIMAQNVIRVTPFTNCLYVHQREFAALSGQVQHLQGLGTDMATTCHIVVLRCPQTKATALGHFDGASTAQGAQAMVDSVKTISERYGEAGCRVTYELHIVGGFEDERGISGRLSLELLSCFNRLSDHLEVRLQTFCCSPLNQKVLLEHGRAIKSPIIFGLVAMIDSGTVHPAVFDDDAKGPARDVRSARSLHGPHSMTSVYDFDTQRVTVSPFTYDEFPHISEWINAPDHFIRKHLSTSPEVEPDNFESNIRDSLRFIRDNPDPASSVFSNYKSLCFDKVATGWRKTDPFSS